MLESLLLKSKVVSPTVSFVAVGEAIFVSIAIGFTAVPFLITVAVDGPPLGTISTFISIPFALFVVLL